MPGDKKIQWLPIIALLVSGISLAYTMYNDRNIKKISFDNNGLQNRPLLKFESLGKIHFSLKTKEPISVKDLYEKKLSNIPVILEVDPELKVTNEGSSIAHILFETVTDKYSGLPEIRRALFDEKKKELLSVQLTDDFYKVKNLLAGKSHVFRFPHTINDLNLELNEFTIHYLIVYQNELGNVFDSYYWVRFKANPIQTEYITDGVNLEIKNDEGQLLEAIKVIDTNFNTSMYSYSESKKITKFVKKYSEKFQ